MLPNGILVDVSDTAYEFFCAEGLGLVEAACPDILLALQTEGEPSFDELHGLFQGNIRSGCDERVEVVGDLRDMIPISEMDSACTTPLETAAKMGRFPGLKLHDPEAGDEPEVAEIDGQDAIRPTGFRADRDGCSQPLPGHGRSRRPG